MTSIIAKGIESSVEFDGSVITIRRLGFFGKVKNERHFPVSKLFCLHFKEAGFSKGYIHFSFSDTPKTERNSKAIWDDENTIVFDFNQESRFKKLKESIEKAMGGCVTPHIKGSSGIDELEKLIVLKEKGYLSEEEFSTKKKQILNS